MTATFRAEDLIAGFESAADAASAAEDEYRREFASRVEALTRERITAFRRLNLVRAVAVAVAERARSLGLRTHVDGARIWNASVASGVPLETYGRLADTASVCLSKGLGAPVGSVLVGPADQIARALQAALEQM